MINTYQTILTEKKMLNQDVCLLKFSLVNPPQIEFKAGQYLILKINDQSRLYSIFSPEDVKDRFELLVKLVPDGLASQFFINLKLSQPVTFEGPAGVFTLNKNGKNKIFLATSTGIAPLWSMIVSHFHQLSELPNCQVYLFWGLRYFNEVFNLDHLKNLSQNQPFKFLICLSREENLDKITKNDRHLFHLGHINHAWEKFVEKKKEQFKNLTIKQWINNFDYYLCGSRAVVESLSQFLLDKGIVKQNIYFEKF